MPWSGKDFVKKGAKRSPMKAARMANHILAAYARQHGGVASGKDEGIAIATALKAVNKGAAKRLKKR